LMVNCGAYTLFRCHGNNGRLEVGGVLCA
jgi:hypothetical protein